MLSCSVCRNINLTQTGCHRVNKCWYDTLFNVRWLWIMHLTLCKVILADLVYFQCSWKMGPLRVPPWFHPHLSAVITPDPDSHNRNSSVSCCQSTTADYWVRDSRLIGSYKRVHYFKTTRLISHLMHSFEHRSFCVTEKFSTVRKVVFFYFMDIRLESINTTNNFQMIRTSADLNSRFNFSRQLMTVSLNLLCFLS